MRTICDEQTYRLGPIDVGPSAIVLDSRASLSGKAADGFGSQLAGKLIY